MSRLDQLRVRYRRLTIFSLMAGAALLLMFPAFIDHVEISAFVPDYVSENMLGVTWLGSAVGLVLIALRSAGIQIALGLSSRVGLGAWTSQISDAHSTSGVAIEGAAARMSSEELQAAIQDPSLTDEARNACIQTLASRGFSEKQIMDWVPPLQAINFPSSLVSGETFLKYMRRCRVYGIYSVILRVMALGLLVLVPFSAFGLYSRSSDPILVAFAGIAVFFLVLLIGSMVLRNRALRILLLRPFGEPRMTNALKYIIVDRIGTLGHVVTLSDKNYRPNHFLRVFDVAGEFWRYLLAQILRPSLRIASVTDDVSFFRLASALMGKVRPSFRGLLSGGQAFNVRSTDTWWRRCIDLLMHSSDFILMDVSRVSTGSAWEIRQLGRRGLLDRCVFIVQEDFQADGVGGLESNLPVGFLPKLHVYREHGEFLDLKDFQAALRQQIEEIVRRAN